MTLTNKKTLMDYSILTNPSKTVQLYVAELSEQRNTVNSQKYFKATY